MATQYVIRVSLVKAEPVLGLFVYTMMEVKKAITNVQDVLKCVDAHGLPFGC